MAGRAGQREGCQSGCRKGDRLEQNTTYTVLKKLIDKGYIRRDEPGFVCSSLITRGEIQRSEARGLLDRFFSGSRKALFSALLEDEELSEAELAELRDLIDRR